MWTDKGKLIEDNPADLLEDLALAAMVDSRRYGPGQFILSRSPEERQVLKDLTSGMLQKRRLTIY